MLMFQFRLTGILSCSNWPGELGWSPPHVTKTIKIEKKKLSMNVFKVFQLTSIHLILQNMGHDDSCSGGSHYSPHWCLPSNLASSQNICQALWSSWGSQISCSLTAKFPLTSCSAWKIQERLWWSRRDNHWDVCCHHSSRILQWSCHLGKWSSEIWKQRLDYFQIH